MRKIGALFMAVVLTGVFSHICPAAALAETDGEDARYEEAYAVLSGLGILEDAIIEAGSGGAISHAAFSKTVINALGGFDGFNLATQMTADITYDQAVRILVTALGYGHIAQAQGGFPLGYNLCAITNGLFKNVSVKGSDAATKRNLVILLYNALGVDLMENLDIGGSARNYKIISGKTLLTEIEKRESIKIISGQIMATPVSSLVGTTDLRTGQVNIDGVIYKVKEGVGYTNLLGRLVLAFSDANEGDGIKTVYAIFPRAGKNKEFHLSADKILSFSNDRYEYETENGKVQYINIPRSISVIYNGFGLGSVSASDFQVLNGSLTLLDTQNSGTYDVLFIDEYKNYLISGIDADNEMITFRQNPYEEKWTLPIKSADGDYQYFISNGKGSNAPSKAYEKGDLSALDKNDVVSVFESRDKKTVLLAISDKRVEGKIDALSYDDGVVFIDGESYKLSRYSKDGYLVLAAELKPGEPGVFYLDVYGEIVCADTQAGIAGDNESGQLSTGYAYVLDTRVDGGLAESVQLRLLLGSVLRAAETDKIEENDLSAQEDGETVKPVKKQIYGQRVETVKCADNVTLTDGETRQRVKSNTLAALKDRMIQFSADSGGLITRITLYSGDERSRKYNDDAKTFTDLSPDGAFMVDEKTTFFVLPSQAETDGDYEVRYSIVNKGYYTITPYNPQRAFDSDFDIARMCLIRSSVNGHRPGLITDNTPISVITRVSTALNESGEITTKVYAYTSGILTGYLMRSPYKGEAVPEAPDTGDVVKLSIDGDGNIDGYVKMISLTDTGLPLFRIGARTTNERLYGLVYHKKQDVLQGLTGTVVKQIQVSYLKDYSDIFTLDISAALEKQMYLYRRGKKSVHLAVYNDILTYTANAEEASKIFLYMVSGEIRGLVSSVLALALSGILVQAAGMNLPVAQEGALVNGTIVFEAEDMILDRKAVTVISDGSASGALAVQVTAPTNTDITNLAANPSLQKDITADSGGSYTLWMRAKAVSTSSYAIFLQTYGGYKAIFLTPEPDYQWHKVAVTLSPGTNAVLFKSRNANFILDKLIVTDDAAFVPAAADDRPDENGEKDLKFGRLPFYPPAGHPRLFVTAESLPALKENVKSDVLKPMYEQVKAYANENAVNYSRPANPNGNYTSSIDKRLKARAFMYLIGEADDGHAKQTIAYMREYFSTVTFPNTTDITREMGNVMISGAMIYDWCYGLMTDDDKAFFIHSFKKLAAQKECGYPPTKQIVISGHSGEREIFLDLIGSAAACYDEDPELYEVSAGRFFDEMTDSRILFNQTGNHPIGSAYGHTRFQWELMAAMIFDRMGYPNVLGEEMRGVAYKWIYQRLPSGYWMKDGDDWSYSSSTSTAYTYKTGDNLVMLLAGALYQDPVFHSEFLREFALADYEDAQIWPLLFYDPNMSRTVTEGLPLSYKTTWPLSSLTARTSWQQGLDAPTAMAFMKGNEKMLADHNHADIGSFQIYYKGALAIKSGLYQGQNGGYGSSHDLNYHKRTISSNSMVVFDPSEIFKKDLDDPGSQTLSNDGGQIFRKMVPDLETYLELEDCAKTEGTLIAPNPDTPGLSYFKTDLTNAYSNKVTDYHRSMVFLDLFNEDYPAAFIVFDKIGSANKNYRKAWLLHSIQTPWVNKDDPRVSTIKRTQDGFNGKLVNKTFLPKFDSAPDKNNLKIDIVGGHGYGSSYVNGVNYANTEYNENVKSEQGAYRLEISPMTAAKEDLFLNAMYVTDYDRNLPELPMYQEESGALVGVTVLDRAVYFSKTARPLTRTFSLTIRDNGHEKMSVLAADVAEGAWEISGGGTKLYAKVQSGENALYFEANPGTYSIKPLAAEPPEYTVFGAEKAKKARVGDYLIYCSGLFLNQKQPAKLVNGEPFIPVSVLEAFGCTVQWDGAEDTASAGRNGHTLEFAPCLIDGVLYANPFEFGGMIAKEISYDAAAGILRFD